MSTGEVPAELQRAVELEHVHFQELYRYLTAEMPPLFFQEISQEQLFAIVHALMDFKLQGYFAQLRFEQTAVTLCFDLPGIDMKILKQYPFEGIKNYATYLSSNPFPGGAERLRIAVIDFMTEEQEPLRKQAVEMELFRKAQESDYCQYSIEGAHLKLAWKNVPKNNFLYRLAQIVHRHGLTMSRFHATETHPYHTDSILLLDIEFHHSLKSIDMDAVLQEIVLLSSFEECDPIEERFVQSGEITGHEAHMLRVAISFIHQVLVHVDPALYSLNNLIEGLCHYPALTVKLVKLFALKFHPIHHDLADYKHAHQELVQLVEQIDTGYVDLDARRKTILMQAIHFVEFTLKTNAYCIDKRAFAFRLDPHYLDHAPFERATKFPQLPFAIFFIANSYFISFHVRFKDLARGGLRTVYPEQQERVLAEQDTIFNECYQLAYTQHKKNKDIPEGGAKAIIFLKPVSSLIAFHKEQQLAALYQTQRTFITELLTLINSDDAGYLRNVRVVDYWQHPEYLYLGPDENMHDAMIEWIAQESCKRHYRPGGAFISGKPSSGINHKEFGVTSLGVQVYLKEVLQFLHIDPVRDTFTVKMTGGPDGDVAGNEMCNLHRDFPHTAKLIALTDVSGTIQDLNGLDLPTLVDLFHQGLSISHYPSEKLSEVGFLLDCTSRRESSTYVSQTLCLRKQTSEWVSGNQANVLWRTNVHQTPADIFIPCGGRPRALCEQNYREFLTPQQEPTARAIVEGANLYLSSWARHSLEKQGVLIIKDSSANKCGVICSSFEILCSLTLTPEEFVIWKPQLVAEILGKLTQLARLEAQLLLSTHRTTQQPLSEISDEISKRINFFTDQLMDYLDTVDLASDQRLMEFYLSCCPRLLQKQFSERLLTRIPDLHKKALIASSLASHLVYQRGLRWFPTIVDILPLIL